LGPIDLELSSDATSRLPFQLPHSTMNENT
jgi:hypothetical protein